MALIVDSLSLNKNIKMNFATIYDYLQQDIDLEKLLEPILPFLEPRQVLIDAGCGSGHILTYLAGKGYKVIGIDNDTSMLSLAQQKIIENQLSAQLFEHDLRTPLRIKTHQIISLLDVSHYFKGVKKLFRNYYQALLKGGVLILDLYNDKVNERESGCIENISYDWQVTTKDNRISHLLTVLVDNDKYNYELKQYYYPLSYYSNILTQLGFRIQYLKSYDDRKIFLICHK